MLSPDVATQALADAHVRGRTTEDVLRWCDTINRQPAGRGEPDCSEADIIAALVRRLDRKAERRAAKAAAPEA